MISRSSRESSATSIRARACFILSPKPPLQGNVYRTSGGKSTEVVRNSEHFLMGILEGLELRGRLLPLSFRGRGLLLDGGEPPVDPGAVDHLRPQERRNEYLLLRMEIGHPPLGPLESAFDGPFPAAALLPPFPAGLIGGAPLLLADCTA